MTILLHFFIQDTRAVLKCLQYSGYNYNYVIVSAHAEVIKFFSKPRIPNNARAAGEGIILNSRVTKQLNNRRAGH